MSLKRLLESRRCIKLVCGAGNEDAEYVRKLANIYIKTGVRYFDVSANIGVIKAVKEELVKSGVEGFINVSYGIKGDPHTNKIQVDNNCVNCGLCVSSCIQDALYLYELGLGVHMDKCVGCGQCIPTCPTNALSITSKPIAIKDTLPSIIAEGVDSIELHVSGTSPSEALIRWAGIQESFKGILSVCIDRSKYSDETLFSNLKEFLRNREPYSTIIQADGLPMSGSEDGYVTTLQAIAIGQIVDRMKLPAYLLLSGGTNSYTSKLAKMCGVKYHGVSLGSYARKVIKRWDNSPNIAIQAAQVLIDEVMWDMGGI